MHRKCQARAELEARRRACRDVADVHFNIDIDDKRACNSIADLHFKVEIPYNIICIHMVVFVVVFVCR